MLSFAVIGLCTISAIISFLRLILFILQHIEIPHSFWFLFFIQFSSVAQLCPTLCNPMDCSTPGLPVHHQLPEFTQTHGDAIQYLILCCPLLLLPSIFPTIRVFSKESVLHISWPKYWTFSISSSCEMLGWMNHRVESRLSGEIPTNSDMQIPL